MANGTKSLIIFASVFCIVAMLFGVDPATAAPASPSSGDLDAGERDVIIGLAEAIIRVSANGLDGSGRGVGKRSNAELVNGLLGMRLGELARAGRR